MIVGANAPLAIDVGTSPTTEVPETELCVLVRPSGLFLLVVQIPTLNPILSLGPDVRLWMRWAEPEETGLDGARIEIAASTSRDEKARTARVIVRTAPITRTGARAMYRLIEMQGLVDLQVFGPDPSHESSPKMIHLLVCADLSQRSADLGLSVDPFPRRYQ